MINPYYTLPKRYLSKSKLFLNEDDESADKFSYRRRI